MLVTELRKSIPLVFDPHAAALEPPSSAMLNNLARLRDEPERREGSSADDGIPNWRDKGLQCHLESVTQFETVCDGQSPASVN